MLVQGVFSILMATWRLQQSERTDKGSCLRNGKLNTEWNKSMHFAGGKLETEKSAPNLGQFLGKIFDLCIGIMFQFV